MPEKEISEKDRGRLEDVDLDHPLVKAIIALNREMGQVQGELKWIKLLMSATTLGVLGQLFYTIFGA